MNQVDETNLSMIETFEQMLKVLGFHDWASFLVALAFLVGAIAFAVMMGIFFIKKRRERKDQLEKIVHEVQSEQLKNGHAENLEIEPEPKPLAVPVEVKKPEKILVKEKVEPKKEIAQPEAQKPEPAPIAPVIVAEPKPEVKVEPEKSLGSALKNTRLGFIDKLSRLFSSRAEISDADFEDIEAILFTADIGVKTAQKLLEGLKASVKSHNLAGKEFLHKALKEQMLKIFSSVPTAPKNDQLPQVIMFVGVNGAGKTTTVGKLGAQLAAQNKKVIFAAGDTFRAAAAEQLALWGKRSNIEVVCGKENADSASVLFEGIEKGKAQGADYILCDTAGRLHTKVSLMEELAKVHRVVGKAMPGAPHEVYLVVDATMGQNAIAQAREFAQSTPLTGVVLSKLDGTAKGGVALGIVDELKVPIRFVGIGEKAQDLKDFDANEFTDALLEEV